MQSSEYRLREGMYNSFQRRDNTGTELYLLRTKPVQAGMHHQTRYRNKRNEKYVGIDPQGAEQNKKPAVHLDQANQPVSLCSTNKGEENIKELCCLNRGQSVGQKTISQKRDCNFSLRNCQIKCPDKDCAPTLK
eukprot:TRINITY_DN1004_c0_g1_i2.p4 TRINITY_DN1004_c0_g1~~TRINITY_DN1004_c0_g1_i2.p4  ORF type:complete len:134 (-),score=0.57 TRINITY_DN1004_c0_g1_i2:148-549(-)